MMVVLVSLETTAARKSGLGCKEGVQGGGGRGGCKGGGASKARVRGWVNYALLCSSGRTLKGGSLPKRRCRNANVRTPTPETTYENRDDSGVAMAA